MARWIYSISNRSRGRIMKPGGEAKRRPYGRLFYVFERTLRQLNHSASFFQFLLRLCGGVFTNTGKHFAASGFSHGLGFAQTEAGELANDLDDVDFLRASLLDDHIEFSLFFNG